MDHTESKMTSTGEMVTISYAEYETMQAQLESKNSELAQTLLQNRWLMEQLKLNKRKLFGSSSEQLVIENFSVLFNEAECWNSSSVGLAGKGKKSTRKRRSSSIEDAIPDSLIKTAKKNSLDPYRYLTWVLEQTPTLNEIDDAWTEKLIPGEAPDDCKAKQD